MPSSEFWVTGYALISGAGFVFVLALTALGVGPVLRKPSHKRFVWSGVSVIALLTWWQLAKQEETKVKPERDYAYFVLSDDPRDNDGRAIRLMSVATGPLKDVDVAIQTAEERKKHSRNYIFYHHFPSIAEGGTVLSLPLPAGDYWIDSDQPAKLGQVLEHILIGNTNEHFISNIRVTRKETGEVLIPAPEALSFASGVVVALICSAFTIFAAVLGWASWIT